MDASQRWETEALRAGSLSRKTPPRPSAKTQPTEAVPQGERTNWVTLKEAEAGTGIPLNTIRKWARKNAIPTYLEPGGDTTLRMVDLDAVVEHAHDLGRDVTPLPEIDAPAEAVDTVDEEQDEAVDVEPTPDEEPDIDVTDDTVDGIDASGDTSPPSEPPMPPEGTLIVPLDAWNKMLNQLGNLHEAGQQLAEARERAAKAETEATFLRERLAEVRAQMPETRAQTPEAPEQTPDEGSTVDVVESPDTEETTSYWKYLTFGWRDRKRQSSKKRP